MSSDAGCRKQLAGESLMARRTLTVKAECHPLAKPFRISGYSFKYANVVVVSIREGKHVGRGEASGVYYLGDDVDKMLVNIEACRDAIEGGADRLALLGLVGPGGARNALDCALWELEAAQSARSVAELAAVPSFKPLLTTFTLGADNPAVMAAEAASYTMARQIKIKITGELGLDLARIAAVRESRPDTWLAVDANQGFCRDELDELVEGLAEHRVALLEQPLPRGAEKQLEGFKSAIPLAADESVLQSSDLPALVGRFQIANIKLDKCGGLTEGLRMAAECRRLGLGVMVGNMGGTSLAMAPAFILGQFCDVVDLDGPFFLAQDRDPGVSYRHGKVHCSKAIWGAGKSLTV